MHSAKDALIPGVACSKGDFCHHLVQSRAHCLNQCRTEAGHDCLSAVTAASFPKFFGLTASKGFVKMGSHSVNAA
jgi:hypothetical protein